MLSSPRRSSRLPAPPPAPTRVYSFPARLSSVWAGAPRAADVSGRPGRVRGYTRPVVGAVLALGAGPPFPLRGKVVGIPPPGRLWGRSFRPRALVRSAAGRGAGLGGLPKSPVSARDRRALVAPNPRSFWCRSVLSCWPARGDPVCPVRAWKCRASVGGACGEVERSSPPRTSEKRKKKRNAHVRLLAVDHSARASMKNAASCEN